MANDTATIPGQYRQFRRFPVIMQSEHEGSPTDTGRLFNEQDEMSAGQSKTNFEENRSAECPGGIDVTGTLAVPGGMKTGRRQFY